MRRPPPNSRYSDNRRTHPGRLLPEVQCRVAIEEVKGPKFEGMPDGWQHRPILSPNHMVKAQSVPEDDIRIEYRTVSRGPDRQPVTFVLIRVHASRIALRRII